MKILFLVPYPLHESPSQRFRFEQYFTYLTSNGIKFTVESFLNQRNWRIFFSKGNWTHKSWLLSLGFFKRIKILFFISTFDYIFIHREAAPLGPPIFEFLIARVLRKKIIFDFDDAIWLTDRHRESIFLKVFKWRRKVRQICRWSYKVSCGNEYLCNYARQFNANVVHNPTTIDTQNVHNPGLFPTSSKDKISIGWTGSHSTLKYLYEIEDALSYILSKYTVDLIIIADRRPSLAISFHFKPWSLQTEILDLTSFDIGLMPLPDDKWSQGKCGFKILQYMAMEIPTVAHPVGVNKSIIQDGQNGFLATTSKEWKVCLEQLIQNEDLRKQFGKMGRKTVINHYSVLSNRANFLSLFS